MKMPKNPMTGLRLSCLAAAGLALAACDPLPPDTEMADACGAPALQNLVGQPLSAFDASLAKGPVRVIGPGMAVTMDYNPARLNVTHSKARIIEAISCG